MAKKYSAGNSGKGVNLISIAVIAVVLVLGVFAVYSSVHTTKLQNKLDSYEATIAQRADSLGMTADDFLTLYGLSDSGLNGSDNEQSAYEKMTLANYVLYNSGTELTEDEFDEFKEAMADQLEDADVTMDTTDLTVKGLYYSYVEQKEAEEQAAQEAAEAETDDTAADAAEADDASEE